MLPIILSLLSLAGGAPAVTDERRATGLTARSVQIDKTEYTYQVYVPAAPKQNEKLPVIVFLHGIGQRGEGGFLPKSGAMTAMIENYMRQANAIIVLPQCRTRSYWSDPEMTRMTLAATDDATQAFGGDPDRTYLVGVSMGGYGVWGIAAEHAGKFAAVVPICGGSPLREGDRFTSLAHCIGRTPVWAFHGAEDRIVPVTESRGMVEALKASGGDVRYNEYEGVGHNVWMNVLREPKLLPWLFSQRRKS